MVDNLGLPTIFFIHSAADMHWLELAQLICKDENQQSITERNKAVIENRAICDWFFMNVFIKYYYKGILNVTDYWLRFEWQH